MNARYLTGTFPSILAALWQAPRGMTVKQWITLNNTRRASGKQGG